MEPRGLVCGEGRDPSSYWGPLWRFPLPMNVEASRTAGAYEKKSRVDYMLGSLVISDMDGNFQPSIREVLRVY